MKTTRENLLRILLESGVLTEEQVANIRSRAEMQTFGVAGKRPEKGGKAAREAPEEGGFVR